MQKKLIYRHCVMEKGPRTPTEQWTVSQNTQAIVCQETGATVWEMYGDREHRRPVNGEFQIVLTR